jgi:hypothetical protein
MTLTEHTSTPASSQRGSPRWRRSPVTGHAGTDQVAMREKDFGIWHEYDVGDARGI